MRKYVRHMLLSTGAVCLFLGWAAVMVLSDRASAQDATGEAASGSQKGAEHHAYLGVSAESLPDALARHMPQVFRNGQGVLIDKVAAGSPAERADVRPQDVLMRYDDQKLFSPEQLAKLVRSDRAGRKVAISLVREGKPLDVQVKLGSGGTADIGSFSVRLPESWRWSRRRFRGNLSGGQVIVMTPSDSQQRGWESFDSMTIKNLGDDRLEAEISYRDQDGKLQSQQFQGTRAEIQEAIGRRKGLPGLLGQYLVRSLDMPGSGTASSGAEAVPALGLSRQFGEPEWVF